MAFYYQGETRPENCPPRALPEYMQFMPPLDRNLQPAKPTPSTDRLREKIERELAQVDVFCTSNVDFSKTSRKKDFALVIIE